MSRRNRVDPFGDMFAVSAKGLLTGNRGCLVGDSGELVRHHRGNLWISCVLKYKDWRSPLAQPGHWTPLFFLDDAVALAAGHRPCGLCRRSEYLSYREAVFAETEATEQEPPTAQTLNRRLAVERLTRGRGLSRAHDRRVWDAPIDTLPPGSVIIGHDRTPMLVTSDDLFRFTFDGWIRTGARPIGVDVSVLTPPTSVTALRNGFIAVIHPSAVT